MVGRLDRAAPPAGDDAGRGRSLDLISSPRETTTSGRKAMAERGSIRATALLLTTSALGSAVGEKRERNLPRRPRGPDSVSSRVVIDDLLCGTAALFGKRRATGCVENHTGRIEDRSQMFEPASRATFAQLREQRFRSVFRLGPYVTDATSVMIARGRGQAPRELTNWSTDGRLRRSIEYQATEQTRSGDRPVDIRVRQRVRRRAGSSGFRS